MHHLRRLLFLVLGLFCATASHAQRQMEALGRGVVATNQGAGKVYVSWRLFGTDPEEITFNVYRASGSAGGPNDLTAPVKLNSAPIRTTTDFLDTSADTTRAQVYYVRPVLNGVEQSGSGAFTLPANAPVRTYLSVPITPPADGTNQSGPYTYSANDCSVGDLDGDGEYEIVVKWDPSNSKDNSQSGYTGNVFIDGYKLDGTRLWRIDLGRNIRAGAHYTQFMVYDLDGDGYAEVACKTADGTVDGVGTVIGNANADFRNGSGYILTGPEFLTIFSGRTGAALATTNYLPARTSDITRPPAKDEWGDDYGNRVDRFLACVAYVDGSRPSLVMCRGYYTRAVLVAWNWRNGQLSRAWTFDSDDGTPGNSAYRGQGNHNLSVGDVDADGRDEIIYGSCAIDDNGKALYRTGLGHGDAMHMSDLDPEHPGLEVFQCHEDAANNGGVGLSFRDARTGAVLWTVPATGDAGRGVTIDIDPRYPGSESWGAVGGLYSAKGAQISTRRPSEMNFAIWWDADPLREILDSNRINKWNWLDGTETRLLTADGCSSNNSTKSNPCLSADIIGDWREEVIFRTSDSKELRIFTTPIPATNRIYTLMHDPQYRLAVAWQNVAYNQPPHPGFQIGDGMTRPPTPVIRTVGAAAPAGRSQLVNLSVLGPSGEGEDTLIVGFALSGASRSLLLRGVGPTLKDLGVSNPLADPTLKLFRQDRLESAMGLNDNWATANTASADAIANAAASVGAFALPRTSFDAALMPELEPTNYSVHLGTTGPGRGPAIVEVYSLGQSDRAALTNVSVRARIEAAAGPLITGFVVRGPAPRTVLIRAVGPELAKFGLSNALPDPRITLYRATATGDVKVDENNDWGSNSAALPSSFSPLGAFGLTDSSKDAALLLNLPEGNYTVHAASNNGSSGVVLVEVYTTTD